MAGNNINLTVYIDKKSQQLVDLFNELLGKYEASEQLVIYENSSNMSNARKELEAEIADYKRRISDLLQIEGQDQSAGTFTGRYDYEVLADL